MLDEVEERKNSLLKFPRSLGRSYLDGVAERAACEEFESGLSKATAALAEVTEDREAMALALETHWGISRDEALDRIDFELRVEAPARKLENYLVSEKGFTVLHAKAYVKDNGVRIKLRHIDGLFLKKPEVIFAEMERSKNL